MHLYCCYFKTGVIFWTTLVFNRLSPKQRDCLDFVSKSTSTFEVQRLRCEKLYMWEYDQRINDLVIFILNEVRPVCEGRMGIFRGSDVLL